MQGRGRQSVLSHALYSTSLPNLSISARWHGWLRTSGPRAHSHLGANGTNWSKIETLLRLRSLKFPLRKTRRGWNISAKVVEISETSVGSEWKDIEMIEQ